MRDIKFRGKRADNGEWVYGGIAINKEDKCFIIAIKETKIAYEFDFIGVIPETIGQYTGLHDKNGKEIFEGDIVLYEDAEMSTENGYGDTFINKGIIEYIEENCCFNVTGRITVDLADVLYRDNDTLEVIGNIYENKELLEEG